nr:pleckstrin homology domain-containing family G member 4B-like [Onthophagus taurus]
MFNFCKPHPISKPLCRRKITCCVKLLNMEGANRNGQNLKDFHQLKNIIEKQIDFKIQQTSYCTKNYYVQPIVFPTLPKNNVKSSSTFEQSSTDHASSEIYFKITGKTFYKLMDFISKKGIKDHDTSNIDTIYDYLQSDVLSIRMKIKSSNFETFKSCGNETVKDVCENLKDVESTIKSDNKNKICTPKYHSLICELIESEYNYVGDLHNLYHNYVLYFKRETFQNFSEIYEFFTIIEQINFEQGEFYKQLMTYKSIEDVASHFIENEKLFALYRNYILNVNDAINFLTIKHRFEVLKRQQELGHVKSLEEHLLLPIQRLNEYISLLENLETHLEQNRISSTKVNAVLLIFKKLLTTSKSDTKIVESITDRPKSLVNYGGFIMKQPFYIRKMSTSFKIIVFLFQEVVIFTIPKDIERYTYVHSIFMKDLYIRPISEVKHSFELMDFHNRSDNNEKNAYILETRDPTIKNTWVEVIESLLWEQLMICKRKVKENLNMDKPI